MLTLYPIALFGRFWKPSPGQRDWGKWHRHTLYVYCPEDYNFQPEHDHGDHDKVCPDCFKLIKTLETLILSTERTDSQEIRDEVLYDIKQGVNQVLVWMSTFERCQARRGKAKRNGELKRGRVLVEWLGSKDLACKLPRESKRLLREERNVNACRCSPN